MKKVLLVNCNTEKIPYPVPPLGLCLIAARLQDDYEVSIYDGMFEGSARLIERVLQFNPDYIGFSIRNIDSTMSDNDTYYVDEQVSRFINPVKKNTSAKIILGGSGFSIFPKELMELTHADFGIMGEGEAAFYQLLKSLDRGEAVVPSGNVLVKLLTNKINPLGSFSSSAVTERYSEIDRKIAFAPYLERGAYSIQTKRGCSHGCIYCTYPVLEGSSFRTRKPEDIADEIEQAHERLGDVMFEFVDSTFNDPKGHAEAICREIIRKKLKLRLRTMGINPHNSSEELFELMMEAGFVQIDATPDSASPVMLANLGKGFNLEETQRMANLIWKFNLPTMWFFLFGGPGENEKTINETISFIDEYINPDDLVYMASGLRIYPGTPLEKRGLKEGVIKSGESLLFPPIFYYSNEISRDRIISLINQTTSERINCVSSGASRPPIEMLQEASMLRKEKNLNEPMFRTLLRIRKEWKARELNL